MSQSICDKKYRTKLKIQVLEHYGNGKLACVKCGFLDIRALTIDHINGGGNAERKRLNRTGLRIYVWLKNQGFPSGYQTLCMNCQMIKKSQNGEYGKGSGTGA